MNNLIIDIISISALVSGMLVITSKNPVYSVLYLISVFINLSGYLLIVGIGFVGLSYLIVYIGAITVLFLFVIIMLNLEENELNIVGKEYNKNIPIGFILLIVYLFELIEIMPTYYSSLTNGVVGTVQWLNNVTIHHSFNVQEADSQFSNFTQIETIGQSLYTNSAISIILISIILLVAIVGPIVLSEKSPSSYT